MIFNRDIDRSDIEKVKSVVLAQMDNERVQSRITTNLSCMERHIDKDMFWTKMVHALLSSVQRVGPGSPVYEFIHADPFPLGYSEVIKNKADMESFIERELISHGGIRFQSAIAKYLTKNFNWLEKYKWDALDRVNELARPQSQETERKIANYIQESLKGFGPKQSRNILQGLGLTRYEIPIDSRVGGWLYDEKLVPIKLTSSLLSNEEFYAFVLDGIQELCCRAEVYPCVLDAAIFSLRQ